MVKTLSQNATAEEIAAHLEDVLRLADIAREQEEKTKWEFE
jgi:hypothetical protein